MTYAALNVTTAAERTADHDRLRAALDAAEECYGAARLLVFDASLERQATNQLTFLQRQSLRQLQAAEDWLRQVREQSWRAWSDDRAGGGGT